MLESQGSKKINRTNNLGSLLEKNNLQTFNVERLCNKAMVDGIVPVNWLSPTLSRSSNASFPISVGKVPVRAFEPVRRIDYCIDELAKQKKLHTAELIRYRREKIFLNTSTYLDQDSPI